MFKAAYIEIEQEFSTAHATLGVIQTMFTQELDAPPNNDTIFWALESVRLDLNRIKEKLLMPVIG